MKKRKKLFFFWFFRLLVALFALFASFLFASFLLKISSRLINWIKLFFVRLLDSFMQIDDRFSNENNLKCKLCPTFFHLKLINRIQLNKQHKNQSFDIDFIFRFLDQIANKLKLISKSNNRIWCIFCFFQILLLLLLIELDFFFYWFSRKVPTIEFVEIALFVVL